MTIGTFSFLNFILLTSVTHPASQQADKINRLFNSFNIGAAAMLLLVSALVIYICLKFREKKDSKREASQTTGNIKLEAAMIGVPMFVLLYFFYQSVITEKAITPVGEATKHPDVIITGHQWWWEVEYPGSNVITANEVHLPAGKHIVMELRSADVIHDWWVPELGNKMDMIPKVNNFLSVDINKPGHYIGACSEFCGQQHAWMRINVIAENEEDYKNWLKANAQKAAKPTDSLAMKGAVLFQSNSCASCHRIGGTNAVAAIGPDLTHVGSREELLTGLLKTNEDNLFKWINHPQQIKEGAYMPNFIYDKDSVIAIAHYLAQLK
ncbi:MAG: cytochrome c oxidase subunit II [Bacteroidota bacterium]|nr:cytochrome c oxidase subunit II [Bacteroidota bacterium]